MCNPDVVLRPVARLHCIKHYMPAGHWQRYKHDASVKGATSCEARCRAALRWAANKLLSRFQHAMGAGTPGTFWTLVGATTSASFVPDLTRHASHWPVLSGSGLYVLRSAPMMGHHGPFCARDSSHCVAPLGGAPPAATTAKVSPTAGLCRKCSLFLWRLHVTSACLHYCGVK